MLQSLTSEAFTTMLLVVVIASYTGLCGFLIGRCWDIDSSGDNGWTPPDWTPPDYPPDEWAFLDGLGEDPRITNDGSSRTTSS